MSETTMLPVYSQTALSAYVEFCHSLETLVKLTTRNTEKCQQCTQKSQLPVNHVPS